MLTSESRYRYTESLKTEHTAFNTPSACIFYAPLAWMRAENNQYQPKPLCSAFSESTPLLILNGDLLKKEHKMNLVQISNKKAITTSKVVADTFGKAHKDVIRAINNLEIPRDFWERNFAPSKYQSKNHNGQILPAYEITRDGFTLLAMGFTGKKAMEFKVKYIQAFNEMEAKLRSAYPCGEVNVREYTRSLPAGKKEIVLSEKAKTEIGGIVKAVVQAELARIYEPAGVNIHPSGMPFGNWAVSAVHAIGAMKSEYDNLKAKQQEVIHLLEDKQ